jgi:hypothetical protein
MQSSSSSEDDDDLRTAENQRNGINPRERRACKYNQRVATRDDRSDLMANDRSDCAGYAGCVVEGVRRPGRDGMDDGRLTLSVCDQHDGSRQRARDDDVPWTANTIAVSVWRFIRKLRTFRHGWISSSIARPWKRIIRVGCCLSGSSSSGSIVARAAYCSSSTTWSSYVVEN